MAEKEINDTPTRSGADNLDPISLLRARMAESRRLRRESVVATSSTPGGLLQPFSFVGTSSEVASLKNEVQMMAKKIEEYSEAIKNMEKKREEDSETIKRLLQVVGQRLGMDDQRADNEVESSPHGGKPHSEESVAVSSLATKPGNTSRTEVEDSRPGHDQNPKASATDHAAGLKIGMLPGHELESPPHSAASDDKEQGTVPSESQGQEDNSHVQTEDLACNQEHHTEQARKECSERPVSALQPSTALELPQLNLCRKHATSEPPESPKLRKRRGTEVEREESNLEQFKKKVRYGPAAGIKANEDTIVAGGPQHTPNSLPTSPQEQAHTGAPAQAPNTNTARRMTRRTAAILARESSRPTQDSRQASKKQAEAPAKPALGFGAGKNDKQRWLVSEQKLVFELINEEKRHSKGRVLSCARIARAYNKKMKGVVQRRGEKTIVGTVLEHKRNAPVRTRSSIKSMITRHPNVGMKEGDSVDFSIVIEDGSEDDDEDGYGYGDYKENVDDEDDVKDEEE